MTQTVEAANYQKTIDKIVSHWTKVIDDVQKELKKVEAELKKLKQQLPTNKKEMDALKKSKDKKVAALAKRLEAAKTKLTNAKASFELNLKVVKAPADLPENELKKLAKDILAVFTKKGAALKPWLNLSVQVLDLKKQKVSITLIFKF